MSWDAIDELETDVHQIQLSTGMSAVGKYLQLRTLVLDKMLPYMRAEHQKLLDRNAEIDRMIALRKAKSG